MDNYDILASRSSFPILDCMYLESAAQTEDTVVGLLGSETLEGGVDNVVLLGEQVIGPVRQSVSSGPCASHKPHFAIQCIRPSPNIPLQSSSSNCSGCSVPQAELPVAGGVGVPVGEGLHPALEPWALHNGGGERWRGHDCGIRRSCAGCRGAACRQWSAERFLAVVLSSIFVRWNWLPAASSGPRALAVAPHCCAGFLLSKRAHPRFVTSSANTGPLRVSSRR